MVGGGGLECRTPAARRQLQAGRPHRPAGDPGVRRGGGPGGRPVVERGGGAAAAGQGGEGTRADGSKVMMHLVWHAYFSLLF